MGSHRLDRVRNLLRQVTSQIIPQVKDPRVGFVTVTDVRIVKVQPKPKRRGRHAGTKPGWKKAIVELQPGDSIDIFEGA